MLGDTFVRILEMSGKGSLVILGVLLARLALKRAPKIFSYLLWGVVLLRLLCPFTLEAPVSILPRTDSIAQEYTLADQPISPAGAGIAVYRAVGDAMNGGLGVQHIPTTQTTPEGNTHYVTSSWWEVWVLAGQYLWAVGAAGMALYSLTALWRLKKRLRVSIPLETNVYLADDIPGPFVLGLISPRIYLPPGLSAREQEYVLLHERHHIRRGDPVFKALAYLVLILHWFNPLVWLAFHLASQDMEMSCDEAVIRNLAPQARGNYAATLLSFATGRRTLVGVPLAFGEGDPKGRIKNLSRWKRPTTWVLVAAVLVCGGVAVTLLTDPQGTGAQRMALFPTQKDSSSQIISWEETQKYLDQIVPAIEEEGREGIYHPQFLPQERQSAQYGFYSVPQYHGNGFTVTLNLITVFDGEEEAPLLAWVEDTPGQLEEYIITPYAYIGLDGEPFTFSQDNQQLVIGVSYSVNIPQGRVGEEWLTAVGYTLHGDGYYTATAQIISYPDSLFILPEDYDTLTITADFFGYLEEGVEIQSAPAPYVAVSPQGKVTFRDSTSLDNGKIAYTYRVEGDARNFTMAPAPIILQRDTQPGRLPAEEGGQAESIFRVEEIMVQESQEENSPWEIAVKIVSEQGEYPAAMTLVTEEGTLPGSAVLGTAGPASSALYTYPGGNTREETQEMLKDAALSWQGLCRRVTPDWGIYTTLEGIPLGQMEVEAVYNGVTTWGTSVGNTITIQADYSRYCEDPENLQWVGELFLTGGQAGGQSLELLRKDTQGTTVTYYYGADQVSGQLYLRPQIISVVRERQPQTVPLAEGQQGQAPFRFTRISREESGKAGEEKICLLRVECTSDGWKYPLFPVLNIGENQIPGAGSSSVSSLEGPQKYTFEFKIPLDVWEDNQGKNITMTYSQLLEYITVKENVYACGEGIPITLAG